MRYWFNGQWFDQDVIQLPLTEPGLLYGATIFTTLRVYHQDLYHPLTHWSAHGDRIRQTLTALAWPQPDWLALTHAAIALGRDYPVLRITLFPNGQDWIMGRNLPQDLTIRQRQGITATLMPPGPWHRSLAHWKTGNYLAPWLAQQVALRQQSQEAILTNAAGEWLETSTGNLWGWRDNLFVIPKLTGEQLPGIAQQQLKRWIVDQGGTVLEETWSPDRVHGLQGMAYSNSVMEVIPINCVSLIEQDALILPSANSAPYRQLAAYFQTG